MTVKTITVKGYKVLCRKVYVSGSDYKNVMGLYVPVNYSFSVSLFEGLGYLAGYLSGRAGREWPPQPDPILKRAPGKYSKTL
jgi:hypothetical protein